MKNKRAKYHLVITDNETGKVLTDRDAKAIIGALCVNDGEEKRPEIVALCEILAKDKE